MTVTAKFHCHANSDPGWSDQARIVRLSPVYGPEGTENAEWSKYTPAGYLEMTITNPAAFEQFVVGHDYSLHLVDVTDASPEATS